MGVLQHVRKTAGIRLACLVDSYAEAAAAWYIVNDSSGDGAALELKINLAIATGTANLSTRQVSAFVDDIRRSA